ncbi:helix-turn-helix domain-containing protein [Burkholderia sp. Bp8991]|uniref:helix-turn-helix domain-containing protein n=1 Tax=Burkholderia sp. Bp8991 TaxID=2184553 RepID=UPI000F5B5B45|nr:helix-turn-helix domain-containing protein [Burkholderia sp. Bp8991]RQS05579.1 helix-turn-helix domain-containing protein [Burkholderia sp. Bp8991]
MARPTTNEIGPNLARLREAAGLKQAELASRLTMSAPSLSRVESGERPLAPDELQSLLAAIGTEEALRFSEYLGRNWSELPVPPLNHPKQDLLWEADQVSGTLRRLLDGDIKASFQKRIEEYLEQIRATAGLLLKRDHTVALIGSIGVGKSTAICRALGLEVSSEDGLSQTVLEVGAGGITVCEVHIYSGPGYGLIVEPCSEDEVRAHVMDFAEYIWRSAKGTPANAADEGDSQGVSKEIERAVRNLSGLRVRKSKGSDGKTQRFDDAKALAATYEAPRDFAVEVLTRMSLHKRDARNVWHDSLSGKAPLVWLRETFLEINNGRHPDFSLPRRIELVVAMPLVPDTDLNIRFVDTKGIDRAAGRADLEVHLQDPHALALLCSKFNNAPGTEARMLLTRAKEAGNRDLDRNAALLVLPHPGEALKMKDDATSEHVESAEEGCELKGEQVETALESTGIRNIPICFFNALEDSRDTLVQFVMDRIASAREGFSTDLKRLVTNVREVIENQAKEQAQAILRDAASQLKHWVSQNKGAPKATRQIQRSLIKELEDAHPSTVHAAVRREGDWLHLNYGYQLGHGARTLATAALGKKVADFTAIADNLRTNPEFSDAETLISQCEQVLQAAFDQLLRKMQVSGESLFAEEMKRDKNFWQQCEREWGQGAGYRDRVTTKSTAWFDDDSHQNISEEIRDLLEQEWKEALERVEAMLQDV